MLEGDPLQIGQKTEFWQYYEMLYVQIRIKPRERDTQNPMWFWDPHGSPKTG